MASLNKISTILLWLMIPALALSNGLLIRQNLQLKAKVEGLKPNALQKGDKVQPFSALGLHDEKTDVQYERGGPSRVLYFTATCPYCTKQFPYWKTLIEKVDKSRFQVIGVVSESEDKIKLEQYLKSFGSESLPVAVMPRELMEAYKLSMTPTSLVVDDTATVQEVWIGKWRPKEIAAASELFKVQF